jgi:hypothetical protein
MSSKSYVISDSKVLFLCLFEGECYCHLSHDSITLSFEINCFVRNLYKIEDSYAIYYCSS